MDWLLSTLDSPHALSTPTEEISPSSPSTGSTEGPGFALRRTQVARAISAALQSQALLPPQLRFPESTAYWTV